MARFRRRNYLINKPVQFAYAAMAIWFVLIGILLVGTITYYVTMNTILSQMEMELTSLPRAGQPSESVLNAARIVRDINNVLARRIGLMLLGLVVVTGVLATYYLHRLAGPVYRIERTIREVLEGKEFRPIRLRTRDYFKSLGEAVNTFLALHNERDTRIRAFLTEAETVPALKAKVQEIRKLIG